MKKLIVIFPVFFALISPLLSMAQNLECESCPESSVARFDLDVQVSEADIEKMGLSNADYAQLYKVAAGVFNALFEEDPSSKCLNYFEGPLATQIDQSIDTASMPKGDYETSLPPASGGLSTQYFLTGSVNRSGGKKVVVRVTLLAGETRELVAEAQMNYDFGKSGFGNGRLIARQLLPLMGKIREFERMKRDDDPEVAIGFSETNSGMVEIIPEKENLKGEETMNVKIRVADCDSAPLRNLELKLSATGGTVNPAIISTDSNGEATVQYMAPCEAGPYTIEASFDYFRPFESKTKQASDIPSYSAMKEVVVEPGKKFQMEYQYTSTQDLDGQFLLKTAGDGVIVCVINYDTIPAQVTGVGMVKASWSGNVDTCLYSGKSNFKVDYKGEIVSGEDNTQWLEIRKVNEAVMGGNFTMNCAGKVQEVPHSFLSPDQEEGRVLKFDLKDGSINEYDVPDTDGHHRYILKMGCN